MSFFKDFFIKIGLSLYSLSDITKLNNILDILLVAIFIYIFVTWIRETRAWSLFKGILILAVLSPIFQELGFYTMAWALKNLFDVGLIAAIVLFQPEIRKALEQLGKGKILSSVSIDSSVINKEILRAAKIMSAERTGALICIEQDVALGEFEKTGIQMDSKITSQLLLNIFVNKTPLHDGAVIIRNNRIGAAACILPVTSQEIGKELGTRHRAAVGLSEVSDAIVIVVSEETGGISLARAGKLVKNFTTDEIFDILQRNTIIQKTSIFPLLRGRK